MLWIGAIIIIATVVAIAKRQETRLILFLAGTLMAILAGHPMAIIDSFVNTMTSKSFVPVICIVMGFVFVLKITKCDAHLVHALSSSIGRFPRLLIPGAIIVTFLVGIPLTSAAALGAAVGSIVIPTLIANGVRPAMAASAVLAGSWGCMFSPGSAHLPVIAKLADTDIVSVMINHALATVVCLAIVVIGLTLIAAFLKEDGRGSSPAAITAATPAEKFKVNYVKAFVPILPLLLLLLASNQIGLIPKIFQSVPLCMFIGIAACFAVTLHKPAEISKEFFAGMGDAYGSIIGIIIAASVFTAGMDAIGLTSALTNAMKETQAMANISATFGPFIISVLSGSADATVMAFNTTITPHAEQFGLHVSQLGSQAFLAGVLGRSMSPVAGVAIICAGMAGVHPFELARRNCLPMLVAAVVAMFILL